MSKTITKIAALAALSASVYTAGCIAKTDSEPQDPQKIVLEDTPSQDPEFFNLPIEYYSITCMNSDLICRKLGSDGHPTAYYCRPVIPGNYSNPVNFYSTIVWQRAYLNEDPAGNSYTYGPALTLCPSHIQYPPTVVWDAGVTYPQGWWTTQVHPIPNSNTEQCAPTSGSGTAPARRMILGLTPNTQTSDLYLHCY